MSENWIRTAKAFISCHALKLWKWFIPQIHSPNKKDEPLTLIEIIGLLAGIAAVAAAFQQ